MRHETKEQVSGTPGFRESLQIFLALHAAEHPAGGGADRENAGVSYSGARYRDRGSWSSLEPHVIALTRRKAH